MCNNKKNINVDSMILWFLHVLVFPELHDQLDTKLNRSNSFIFAALQ